MRELFHASVEPVCFTHTLTFHLSWSLLWFPKRLCFGGSLCYHLFVFFLASYHRDSHTLLNPKHSALITYLQGQNSEINNFAEHRTTFEGQLGRECDFKCFWSSKEKITAFHIHILYFEWLQTNLRESPEYWLVCAWELTLGYVIRRACRLIKPLLTLPRLWWNLNCLFPLSGPLWEAWQGIIPCLLMTDGPAGSAQRCLLGTWQRWAGSRAQAALQTSWPAGTPGLYHRWQQTTLISSRPWGFNIMVQGKCLLVLRRPHSH